MIIRDCPTCGTRGCGVLKTPLVGWGFGEILNFVGGFFTLKATRMPREVWDFLSKTNNKWDFY